MVGNRIDIQHPRLKESGVVSKNQDEACRLAGCIALQWKFVRFTSGSRNFLAGPYLESEGRGVRASICFEAIYTGEKRGVARALSSPIEVSFFIGRELILRRWKCTFTDRCRGRGKGPEKEKDRMKKEWGKERERERERRWPEAERWIRSYLVPDSGGFVTFQRKCTSMRAYVCPSGINVTRRRSLVPDVFG